MVTRQNSYWFLLPISQHSFFQTQEKQPNTKNKTDKALKTPKVNIKKKYEENQTSYKVHTANQDCKFKTNTP